METLTKLKIENKKLKQQLAKFNSVQKNFSKEIEELLKEIATVKYHKIDTIEDPADIYPHQVFQP
jgi:hypothetical protein